MIRVLQCVNDMHRAGLETMLMNYYRHIDRDKIQFDFLTHRPYRSDYDDEIESLGGKIYYAPRLYPQNYPKYFKWMKSFFDEHKEYKIVHSHIDAMSYLPLKAAKKANIPIRIAHSHNTSIDRDFKYLLKQYYRFKITTVANYYCACGKEAGQFLFPQQHIKYIPNAIEINNFLYDEQEREKKRKELDVSNKIVLGHVGRLSYQKNHMFLLDIFKKVSQIHEDAILLLVGTGEKEQEIKNKIHDLCLDSKVLLLGKREDVNDIYQAMDIFVMPSLFEGVPVTGIEAQFAGLPCVFSDRVPQEVDFTGNCNFVGLDRDINVWVEIILQAVSIKKRDKQGENVRESKYNINIAKDILSDYYLSLMAELS